MAAGLIGVAVRRLALIAASSGVAFGTVQAGAWDNGQKSKEVIKGLKTTISDSFETLKHGHSAKVS